MAQRRNSRVEFFIELLKEGTDYAVRVAPFFWEAYPVIRNFDIKRRAQMNIIPVSRVSQRGRGISFILDPEALGCLLHEILDLFAGSDGTISTQSVFLSARSLGYQGPASAVRRLLVGKCFVSDAEKGKTFHLHEINRTAIENFFRTHERNFESRLLDSREKDHIFETSGAGGSHVEVMMVRVMRFLSVLLGELRFVSAVESKTFTNLSELEIAHFVQIEHVEWCQQHFDEVAKKLDLVHETLGMSSVEFRETYKRYVAAYECVSSEVDDAITKSDLLQQLARDAEIIVLLKQLQDFLIRFTVVFLQHET